MRFLYDGDDNPIAFGKDVVDGKVINYQTGVFPFDTEHSFDSPTILSVNSDILNIIDGESGYYLDFINNDVEHSGFTNNGDDKYDYYYYTEDDSKTYLGFDSKDFVERSDASVYGRVAEENGVKYLQYYFFYCENMWESIGYHEGDWEFMQIMLGEDQMPTGFMSSVHLKNAQYRTPYDQDIYFMDDHIVVFPADGVHPIYYTSGVTYFSVIPDTHQLNRTNQWLLPDEYELDGVDEDERIVVYNSDSYKLKIVDDFSAVYDWMVSDLRWGIDKQITALEKEYSPSSPGVNADNRFENPYEWLSAKELLEVPESYPDYVYWVPKNYPESPYFINDNVIKGGRGLSSVDFVYLLSSMDFNLPGVTVDLRYTYETYSFTAGQDEVTGTLTSIEKVYGSYGKDTIKGGVAVEVLVGRSGDDEIDGGFGSDRLYGGYLPGEAGTIDDGDDNLFGGGSDDFLFGGTGDDILDGGLNDDYLDGGTERDMLYGGDGDDTLVYDAIDKVISGGKFYGDDGDGYDTLKFVGQAEVYDGYLVNVKKINAFDFTDPDSQELFYVSLQTIDNITDPDITLVVVGGPEDAVQLDAGIWLLDPENSTLSRYEGKEFRRYISREGQQIYVETQIQDGSEPAGNQPPTGEVLIDGLRDGDAWVGDVLQADTSTLDDPDGLGTLHYQWYAGSTKIAGAKDSLFTVTEAELGKQLRLYVSYVDGAGKYQIKASDLTPAVTSEDGIELPLTNHLPIGAPVITGSVTEESVLGIDTSTLKDADGLGTFSYQWLLDGQSVIGATDATFTLANEHIGSTVSVTVSYTDGNRAVETLRSDSTEPVKPINPGNDYFVHEPGITHVNAGDGEDVLIVHHAGSVEFSELAAIYSNLEVIDLSDADVQQLNDIQVADVVRITDDDNALVVLGKSDDRIAFNSFSWELVADSVTLPGYLSTEFSHYQNNVGTVHVYVEDVQASGDPGSGDPGSGTGSVIYYDEFNGSTIGNPYGITYVETPQGQGVLFRRENESRIQYGFNSQIPKEGTLEFVINVDSGYQYLNYTLKENLDYALVFTTDIQGGDVTWPGSTWLSVGDDGDIQLRIATQKYGGEGPEYRILAENTAFRFDEWHSIGISYGSEGQYIMLDGEIVASNTTLTQQLGRGGTHYSPVDIPTIGESVPGFWRDDQWEGGFNGVLESFRVSNGQQDWYLSATTPGNASPTGTVAITGQAEQGETLSADTSTLGDADGLGAFSYQWIADGAAISGATAASYQLGESDLGKSFQVMVSYTDGKGTCERVISEATSPIEHVNVAPTTTDDSITIQVESSKVLRLSDFGRFNDADGDNLELVKFTGLPSVGTLENRVGSDWVEVSATGFEINFYDIMSGRLRYTAGSEATPDALDFLVSDGELWSAESHTLRVYVAENRELGSGDQTITDAGGATVVTVSLPETIRATGSVIGAGTDVVEQLKALSNEEIGTRAAQEEIAERIESFIPSQGSESVYALKLMPGDNYDGSGIRLTGGESGGALVIDASELPRGTVLNLNDVEFAVIIGPVRLDGGDGRNIVVADGSNQYIVLGEEDDTLDGGAGDDTVGSAGGDDVIDGGSGNDLVFGGAGNDTLDGGDGDDIAEFQGDYADYLISFDRESETWTVQDERDASVEGHDGTDTVTGVEQFRFGDMSKTAEAHEAGVQVTHWKSGAAINGVSETITDVDSDRSTSAMTDEAGQASNGMLLQGRYSLEVGKEASSADASAVSVTDALSALKIAFGVNPNGGDPVSPYQYLASDVDQNGQVQVADALTVLKRAFGIDQTDEWAFVTDQVEQIEMSRIDVDWGSANIPVTLDQDTRIDLVGVLLGDVNGSWAAA